MLLTPLPLLTLLQARTVLGGCWKLVYTSNTQTLMLLNALRSVPLVDIGEVYQVIDTTDMTAINKVGGQDGVGHGVSREAMGSCYL